MRHCLVRAPVLLVTLGLASLCAWGCARDSDTYADCVLKALKGSPKSDLEVRLIIDVCRDKYPQEEDANAAASVRDQPTLGTGPERSLNPEEVKRIEGQAGPRRRGFLSSQSVLSGSLYNGNTEVHVTEVTLLVTTTSRGKEVSRRYRVVVPIEPESSGRFESEWIEGDEREDFSVAVVDAKGIEGPLANLPEPVRPERPK